MDLFEQAQPIKKSKLKPKKDINPIKEIKNNKEIKISEKPKKRKTRKKKPAQEVQKIQEISETKNNFNELELVDEIHKAEVNPQPYEFSSYKNNLFSLYLHCDKFIAQKPYFEFSQEKNLYLSNNEFNDFFDLRNKKIILNMDDFEVISYIVKSFINDLKDRGVEFILVFNRLIPLEFFLNYNEKTNVERRCNVCPFYDLKNQTCLLN
jgi:hypothetical protein